MFMYAYKIIFLDLVCVFLSGFAQLGCQAMLLFKLAKCLFTSTRCISFDIYVRKLKYIVWCVCVCVSVSLRVRACASMFSVSACSLSAVFPSLLITSTPIVYVLIF